MAYHYVAGLPYAEIAEILGGTTDAARRAAADGIKEPAEELPGRNSRRSAVMNVSPDFASSPSDAGTLARLRLRLGQAADAEGLLDVAYTTVDSPVGTLLLAATPKGLVRVAYDIEDHDRVLETLSERISPRVLRAPKRLDAAARELDEYFAGRRQAFDLPLDLSLSRGFRQLVQRHLPEIGYGQTRTYGQVAALVGNPKAVRAVGTACATNPLPARRALPPGAAGRRDARRLRRRPRGQGNPAQPGGGAMNGTRERPGAGQSERLDADPWQQRVDSGDWGAITAELDSYGGALLPQLLTPGEAEQIRGLYDQPGHFRSTVNMGRHRFGEGEYRYFARPVPRAGRAAQAGAVPAAAADRPRLVGQARPPRPVAGHAR